MQLIITDARLRRSYCLNFSLTALALGLAALLLAGAAGLLLLQHQLHKGSWREQAGSIDRFLGVASQASEAFAAERALMRQNIDDMARQLGQMQARLLQLQGLSERVADLAGLPAPGPAEPAALLGAFDGGAGGPLVGEVPLQAQELRQLLQLLDTRLTAQADFLTAVEAQLFSRYLAQRMIPTQAPVPGRVVGSGFGLRIDPFNGRKAQHMGLDFQAPTGTPILAAAGGIVITHEYHHAYGNLLEIDHGNGLVTRYAHASKLLAQRGDVVRRGETIAEVGSTGRSTGAHLHFEVLHNGQQQDPQRFLNAGRRADWSDLLAQF
ncbi:M23 family metallopeptidase [Vandammella animalimorsus]|uniref:M23 family metallopeptidase n=1 Tax=Vandammella animalimorsus TaxID=2029117 RepID=A0A3M6RIF0_9BURK|nr:M23 family metallopeptidase [Vandammella animalimorsus]RMX15057.1 M23 family metallopeptidase [Vandammella animalimorsus]